MTMSKTTLLTEPRIPNEIPVHLLHAFVIFSESNSIREAAEKLGITQPALSKQLMALERQLPIRAFTQVGKRKTLTRFGHDLHLELRSRLLNLNDIVTTTSSLHANPTAARVRIAARREILDRLVDRLKFSGIIEFIEAGNAEIISAVTSRKADLGITHAEPDSLEIVAKRLFRETFQIVVPKRLAPRDFNEATLSKTLPSLPCLAYKLDDEVLSAACSTHKIDKRRLRTSRITSNYSSLAKMVDGGFGWAVLPTHVNVSFEKNHRFPLSPRIFSPRDFRLIYRQEFAGVPWFKALRQEVMETFQSGDERNLT